MQEPEAEAGAGWWSPTGTDIPHGMWQEKEKEKEEDIPHGMWMWQEKEEEEDIPQYVAHPSSLRNKDTLH